jgi:lactobin A/cerein 7B family class IIb bacteriocin
MKNQTQELHLEDFSVELLKTDEMKKVNGGILPLVGAALGLLGGVALLAYGAGYLYGKLTCDCK